MSSEPIVVPQPASDQVGVIHGVLLRITDDGQRVPLAGYNVYLGTPLTNNQGVESIVQMNPSTAPRAITNALGQFLFTDIASGRYGLMIDSGADGNQALLNDPEDGGNMLIDLAGGQVIDMGEMAYPIKEP